MRRADRIFLLVQVLRNRRVATAEDLARELGVSKRTVYRDVRDLELSGIPIEGEAGVGYRLRKGFELPPMTLTPSEIEALVLRARMVEAWGDAELGTAARGVLTKMASVLPSPLRPLLDDAALFAPARSWSEQVTKGLGVLREAIAGRRRMRVDYMDRGGEVTQRTLRPLGLYFWGNTWTLAAWCEMREDYRNFRPDRIHAMALLDDRFNTDHPPNLAGFLEAMTAREPGADGRH